MSTTGTFTPDPKTVEWLLKLLEEEGVQYSDCTWMSKIQGMHLEDGHLIADNQVTGRKEGDLYHSTIVWKTKPNGDRFRSLMIQEHHGGRDKIGDSFVEVRLHPNGRYMVHVQLEQVFVNEDTWEWRPRAVRSSVDNPDQALTRRVVDFPNGIWSNPARIMGLRIAQHFANPGWGSTLEAKDYMDIADYGDSTDAMGHSTLLKALQKYDAEVADEMYKQLRDPDRCKVVK
jgi:hypothetical protein